MIDGTEKTHSKFANAQRDTTNLVMTVEIFAFKREASTLSNVCTSVDVACNCNDLTKTFQQMLNF